MAATLRGFREYRFRDYAEHPRSTPSTGGRSGPTSTSPSSMTPARCSTGWKISIFDGSGVVGYGFGIRTHTPGGFVLRMDFAKSDRRVQVPHRIGTRASRVGCELKSGVRTQECRRQAMASPYRLEVDRRTIRLSPGVLAPGFWLLVAPPRSSSSGSSPLAWRRKSASSIPDDPLWVDDDMLDVPGGAGRDRVERPLRPVRLTSATTTAPKELTEALNVNTRRRGARQLLVHEPSRPRANVDRGARAWTRYRRGSRRPTRRGRVFQQQEPGADPGVSDHRQRPASAT